MFSYINHRKYLMVISRMLMCIVIMIFLSACNRDSDLGKKDSEASVLETDTDYNSEQTISEADPETSLNIPDEIPVVTLPDSIFTYLSPKGLNTLEDIIADVQAEYDEIDAFMTAATKEVDFSLYSNDFRAANVLYESGKYEEAKKEYEAILELCPVHLGARNNYVLTLVNLEEHETALSNSILLGMIHPDYEGNQINVLIPWYALGYDIDDFYLLYDLWFEGDMYKNVPDDLVEFYVYNYMYIEIETEFDNEYERNEVFSQNQEMLELFKNSDPDDSDYIELLNYLEGLYELRFRQGK